MLPHCVGVRPPSFFQVQARREVIKVIDRWKLHAFVDRRCDEIEAEGDWVSVPAYPRAKRAILTAYQEEKLKALRGNTYGLSLAEGIAYRIGNYLIFHASEFVQSGQVALNI